MTFSDAPFGVTVRVLRNASKRDRTGDRAGASDHHQINNVAVDWGAVDENTDRREQPLTQIQVFVPKGSDLVASDLIELPNGVQLRIVGRGRWDQVHSMSGFDFGFVEYRAEES